MIGIFDSGIGGLTVAKEIFAALPDYQVIYFGDTAHLPYGTKSPHAIKEWTSQIVRFLLTKKANVIVIACHTASAVAFGSLKKTFKTTPIFEIITPAIEEAMLVTKNGKIGVIGTFATVKSGVYAQKFHASNPSLKIYSKACPLLTPLVEEGWLHKKETTEIVKEYLQELKREQVDTLVLGCTHYPLLRKTISEIMGPRVTIIDPGKDLAATLKKFLAKNKEIARDSIKGARHQFFVSDNPYNFKVLAQSALGQTIHVKLVTI